jgi:FKBP-type peptidyl-prolyl cis-trans isomerase
MNRALALLLPLGLAACGGGGGGGGGGNAPTTTQPTLIVGNLVVEDLVVGTGPVAETGDTVTVDYVGRLEGGAQFDSSYDRGEPFTFTAGAGQVIPGWDQGVPGMRVGGTRRLTIPPNLGYGLNQVGSIPPNSTLTFEIELRSIEGK